MADRYRPIGGQPPDRGASPYLGASAPVAGPRSAPGTRGGVAVGLAIGATTVGALPVFLLGGLSVQITEDLRLPVAAIGIVVATFWGASAIFSVLAGRLGDRLGARAGILAAVSLAAASLIGVALLSYSWLWLAFWMGLAGLANAPMHPCSNALIKQSVSVRRRGLAFGVKQAAIPIATMLAGLAVPVMALTVGWRWTFAAAAGLTVIPLFLLRQVSRPHREPTTRVPVPPRTVLSRPLRLHLGLTTVTMTLAAAQTSSLGAFVVLSAVAHRIPPAQAGLLLAVGSVMSVICRIAVGAAADRGIGGSMRTVAIMLVVGATGELAMARPEQPPFVLGCLLAFGGAWGFPGLVHYVVGRISGGAIARATGIVQSGTFAGGIIGPLVIGLVLHTRGQAPAWGLAAALAVLAGGCALLASRIEPRLGEEVA